MILLRRKAHFNAAHCLHNPAKSDKWNQDMFGNCNNVHGHNFGIEAVVAGEPDPETGFIIDLKELKQILKHYVVDACDHRNLNSDVDFLEGMIPSTENLVKAFFERLEAPVTKASSESGFLYAVKLSETERNSAVYCPYLFDEEL